VGVHLVGFLLWGSVGCASVTKKAAPPAQRSRPCPAPEFISDAERRALEPIAPRGEHYLRTCEEFPSLPRWHENPVEGRFRICVHPRGFVYDVTSTSSTGDEVFDKMLRISIRKWRYQPVQRDGIAVPFCHLITIAYKNVPPDEWPLPTPGMLEISPFWHGKVDSQ
jgi:outer membrane biosynthesis protein TonB